ncbi:MAG: hypothetical protein HWE34_02105 [Methylocystaceae bacterium]|nr:hypothetical protein [Methylocystaceae bacterium]
MSNKNIHVETLAKQLANILSKEKSSSETPRIPFGHLITTCINNLAETLESDPNKKLNPFIDILPFKSGIDFDSFLKKELKIKILQDLGYEEVIDSDEND